MRLLVVCAVCGGRLKAEFQLDLIRGDDTVEIEVRPHRCSEAKLKSLVRMADGSINEDDWASLKKEAYL